MIAGDSLPMAALIRLSATVARNRQPTKEVCVRPLALPSAVETSITRQAGSLAAARFVVISATRACRALAL